VDDPAYFGTEVGRGIHRLLNEFWPDGKAMGPAGVIRTVEQVSPTIDTFGCAKFHPFGNGKPQKRAGPATRKRRKPRRRQAPPFPESVIHRELAFQAQIPW
jgi:hypothetical protein